jgi:hypothetical protein
MGWTKPGPVGGAKSPSLYPNRRVNGTNLDYVGIESLRVSVASMSYGEEKTTGRTLVEQHQKSRMVLPTQHRGRRNLFERGSGLRLKAAMAECKS